MSAAVNRMVSLAIIALSIGLVSAAHAQDDSGLPTVRALACENGCANSTPAITTDSATPPYPSNLESDGVEGFVQLRYTVGTDGIVKDIVLLHLVGPKELADISMAAQKAKKYAPATLNGRPTEQSRTIDFFFVLNGQLGGRPGAIIAYTKARTLIQDKKFDEASAILSEEMSKSNLNFFERGMMDNLVATIAINKNDFLGARSASELPIIHLSVDVSKELMRDRIIADLGLNDIDDAIVTLGRYKNSKGFNPADPLLKLVDDVRAKLDALPQIATLQRIPATNEGIGRYFALSRRNFSFTTVSGSLDKFNLNCRQQTIESQITANAEWHVPKDWDQCFLVVEGAPGTVYQVNQFSN